MEEAAFAFVRGTHTREKLGRATERKECDFNDQWEGETSVALAYSN